MPKLQLTDEEARRVAKARARAERLELSKTEIALRIGRTRQNVTEVLNGTAWSPGTLRLIEDLLEGIEAGTIQSPIREPVIASGLEVAE